MSRKPRQYDDDDGRTIADMNVEGMPWYVKRTAPKDKKAEQPEMTRRESLAMMGGMMKAALLIGLAFFAVIGLFIALCDFVIF